MIFWSPPGLGQTIIGWRGMWAKRRRAYAVYGPKELHFCLGQKKFGEICQFWEILRPVFPNAHTVLRVSLRRWFLTTSRSSWMYVSVCSLWTEIWVTDERDEALERNLTGRQRVDVVSSDMNWCFFIRASFHRYIWKVVVVSSFSLPLWHYTPRASYSFPGLE